jgi:hypothetical protein
LVALDQFTIDLAAKRVDARDLHARVVAEAKLFAGSL